MNVANEQVRLMGTVIDLQISHTNAQEILKETILDLKMYEKRFSANDPTSELMAVNTQAGIKRVKVNRELFELIKLGKEHSLAEGSLLNIAIGPLVQKWRIGFSDATVPNDETIKELLQTINPKKILLNETEHSVYLEKGMLIDLGALAKGFIGDLVLGKLKQQGVRSALINLGGNILTLGTPPNKECWKIGIRTPGESRESYDYILKVKDKSIVTSGIYERVLKTKNKTYHHILSPITGYPMETETLSLTIVSDKSVDGEIWTTRLFGQTPAEIMNEINQHPEIEGILITKIKTYLSRYIKNYIN